jgi:branched-chain amino acid transport system permease protein
MLQQIVNTLINASIYALFALGYALVFGVLDILNLAHGAIFMVGGMAAVQAVLLWHTPLVVGVIFGILVGGVLGVVLDLVTVAPLRARGADFLAPLISTLAASAIFVNITLSGLGAVNTTLPGVGAVHISLAGFGPNGFSFPTGSFPDDPLTIGSVVVRPVPMLRYSKLGRAIRAVAANRLAAQLAGIDVRRTIAITFFLASALGALAGIFYGLNLRDAISYDMGDSIQLRGLAIIVVGGMDSIPGVLLGSLLLAASETLGVVGVGSTYRDAIGFGLLFLVLVIRPSGLLGRRGLRAA